MDRAVLVGHAPATPDAGDASASATPGPARSRQRRSGRSAGAAPGLPATRGTGSEFRLDGCSGWPRRRPLATAGGGSRRPTPSTMPMRSGDRADRRAGGPRWPQGRRADRGSCALAVQGSEQSFTASPILHRDGHECIGHRPRLVGSVRHHQDRGAGEHRLRSTGAREPTVSSGGRSRQVRHPAALLGHEPGHSSPASPTVDVERGGAVVMTRAARIDGQTPRPGCPYRTVTTAAAPMTATRFCHVAAPASRTRRRAAQARSGDEGRSRRA